ncbi:MAG: glycosyltransferase family 4 protein [Pseudomonadales bacterium]|nr:glycosyltransferase family 4 protein [Pseudomonadales bacterium]
MNILFFSKSSTYLDGRIGGAETSVRLIAEKLAERGHNISYLTFADPEDKQPQPKTVNGVSVYFFDNPKYRRKYFFKKKKISKTEQQAAFKEFAYDVISENKVQLIYAHYDRASLKAFLNIKEKLDYKLVLRMAGLKWKEESQKAEQIRSEYDDIFNSVDSINYNTPGLLDLSHDSAKQVGINYQPKDEFVTDIGGFAERNVEANDALDQNHFNIVVATRFSSYQKRQDILVEAIQQMDNNLPIKVTMIGSGPERENIEALISKYGLESKIDIMPFVDQNTLWQILKSADLLCHPCEYEGLSKIIVESMLLGLPVLASKAKPLDDYVIEGKTGFLVENKSELWAKKILDLHSNKNNLSHVGEAAKEYAKNKFDSDRNILSYEKEFQRIISKQD